jgi:A/G-specific adenine glycosylase
VRDELLAWYAAHGRDLPWRRTRDPYRLLVSEVMLQQTQVARVVPVYGAWLERFRDERALAGAAPADVLRVWSGLGYNRRALALRAAARIVARDGWPHDAAGLRALPGVGPYTAAAVAAFAWDEPVAAVDTNVRRVIERRDGVRRGPAALARRAAELVPAERAAAWNQAMMELGATVCRPRAPRCDVCPVRAGCAGPGPAAPQAPRRRVRFEDSDRWARGRVVAALAVGVPLPRLADDRRERVLAGLERDGLVVRRGALVALPGAGGDDGEVG